MRLGKTLQLRLEKGEGVPGTVFGRRIENILAEAVSEKGRRTMQLME